MLTLPVALAVATAVAAPPETSFFEVAINGNGGFEDRKLGFGRVGGVLQIFPHPIVDDDSPLSLETS